MRSAVQEWRALHLTDRRSLSIGTAVADLDGAPEALAQHHQSGVEELTNISVDRWQSLYRIAMRQLENRADAKDRVSTLPDVAERA
jgi:hypothetical protein